MTAPGVRLTLLIGPTVAIPVPPFMLESLRTIEVTHKDEGQSGFQISFHVGRNALTSLPDYPLLANPLLKPFNRVIVMVTFGAVPSVLMDGIITRQELNPGDEPGTSTLTVKGEDVSVMMDRKDESEEHPAQPEPLIALKLIARYAQYGLMPIVIPPGAIDFPLPMERIPVQQGTDLQYLRGLAERHGYVFYVMPGPVPFTNVAYWGPPIRVGMLQRAITVNMGPETNAKINEARTDAAGPTMVEGEVQDRSTGQKVPVKTFSSFRAPLAAFPSWLVNFQNNRQEQFRESGVNASQALARAQGTTERASDTVKVEGELDAGRYGGVLRARGLVGVRGAGYLYDGLYYVKQVTHKVALGSYSESFELTREGVGSTTPVVPV
jgi:hypothetical protein